MKSKRRKTIKRKRRKSSAAPRARRSATPARETEVARLKRELHEALEQQAATTEVLKVISSSPGELNPVFQSLLENATRICGAKFGALWLREGELFRAVAVHGAPQAYRELLFREPLRPGPDTGLGRLLQTKRFVQIEDITQGKAYRDRDPLRVATVELAGGRTLAEVPLLKDGELIGSINIYKQEVRRFTDKQIELLQNFAAQAVIAIENSRLLNELRQRTDDLSESLKQQTATSELLGVISSSPGELEPVFQTMLENATRICGAKFGVMMLREGDAFRVVSMHNAPPAYIEERRHNPWVHPRPSTAFGQVIATKDVAHIADVAAEQDTMQAERKASGLSAISELAGARTMLIAPLLKDDQVVGVINIFRQEVHPFTDKQIALVKNFAAQAVIAIENTRLLNELRRRTDDLSESLEQQTATSEVLKVISSSPGELEPVFNALLENAVRICGARFGNLLLAEGMDAFRHVALHGAPQVYEEGRRKQPIIQLGPKTPVGRCTRTGEVVQIADFTKEQVYLERDPSVVFLVEQAGARTVIAVPMLKEGKAIGAIIIYRQEIRPFTDKQIALVQNFAAQAVIAIENTRLLSELRQRTNDLTESLEQQTATSEVLKVISTSPGELNPVFDAMLENATRICQANFGILFLSEGDAYRTAAMHNAPPALIEARRREPLFRPPPDTAIDRMKRQGRAVQIADMHAEPGYFDLKPGYSQPQIGRLAAARTVVAVPMLKDEQLIGAIVIYRQEVRVFTDQQIELVQNFAAQAVIAIENTRLLSELRESLQQQTATLEVLQVISSSPGELEPVFKSMLENATRICEAKFGTLFRYDGKLAHRVAAVGTPAELVEFQEQRGPFEPDPRGNFWRCLKTKVAVHAADELAEPKPGVAAVHGGARSTVHVPMLKDNEPIGIIVIYRQEVRPFTDKQIELVQNFAAQAVIAIENTRLLNELRESLQQQTATADVLKAISRSTFDLQTVLDTLIESAARLSDSDMASINRQQGATYRQVANYGQSSEAAQFIEAHPIAIGRGTVVGRTITAGKPIQIVDVLNDPEFSMTAAAKISGVNTMLGVPLMRESLPVGVMVLQRRALEPYTDKQIELLTTFADQAVIAIENTRLFDEIQDKSRQLAEASQHKSQFLANMSHELRTPLNAILGYTELVLDGIYGETPEKAQVVLKRVESNGRHLLGLINDVLDLSKIEAGELKLALDDYSMKDVVHNVFSAVEPLATKKGLGFKVELPPDLPAGHGDERKLTQVVLNLIGNAIKFTDAGEVGIRVAAPDGAFVVAVHDTGPGISAADQGKLFEQFQQADNSITKAKGGTGLGLAISRKIIELHGGSVGVESSPGNGSTFTFTLPVTVKRQARTS